ncbi:hypothetical protein ACF0H5_023591 [Mactra antiquata]
MKLIVLILFTVSTEIKAVLEHDSVEKWFKNVDEDLTRNDVKLTDKGAIKVSEVLRSLLKSKSSIEVKDNNSVCSCQKYDCGCCIHLEVDKIHLNDIVCANFTYLPDQYGVSLTLSLDGKVIINETVSARNPPPLCVGVPYLEKLASICAKFEDLSISNKTLSGCVFVLARLEGISVKEVKLGCFKIPPDSNATVPIEVGINRKLKKYQYDNGENEMKDSNMYVKSWN